MPYVSESGYTYGLHPDLHHLQERAAPFKTFEAYVGHLITLMVRYHVTPKSLDSNFKPMTSGQYLKAIDRLGLSQIRAGRFFGVSDRQAGRWARGEIEISPIAVHLINLMLQHGVMPADLDKDFRVE